MKYYIVKIDVDYADEFDVQGFELIKSELDQKSFKKQYYDDIEMFADGEDEDIYPIEGFFGTNENIRFENRKELEEGITIKEITEEEYKVIKKVLGNNYGHSLF